MESTSFDVACTAPEDFQLSTELDDANERLGCDLLKCPLCHKGRRNFYCKQCVQDGEFTHSVSVYSGRFVEKQQKLLRLEIAKNQLQQRCTRALEIRKRRDKLICDINACKERIKLLETFANETRKNIAKENELFRSLIKLNLDGTIRIPKHTEHIEKLRKKITDTRVKQGKQKESIERKRQQVKKLIRISVKQLIKYIFPLTVVEPTKSKDDGESSTDSITSALADASGTSYVRGKWIKINDTENRSETHYQIVAPTLPGSGDYSAYTLWVSENKDGIPGGTRVSPRLNPAWNTIAGLTYTTQLVNALALYLNVRLPYKLTFSEFYRNEMSDQKFAKKVARLNSNVLHLCITQNTNISILQPTHTIENLMHLLNTDISDLGRVGIIEVDPVVITNVHNQLVPDLDNGDVSTDEEDDPINCDWESTVWVPHMYCPEMIDPTPDEMSSQLSNLQVNQSVAGGLVTSAVDSIASIWKGWTTR